MTEEQKKQLRKGVDEVADGMYNTMLQSYEMVEKDMPASLSEEQKQEVFTAIFKTCFDIQTKLLQATVADTKQKVKDQDFVLKMAKEVHNARNKSR